MSGKSLGRIAQFVTNIGLYFTTPEKLLHNVEKYTDELSEKIEKECQSGKGLSKASTAKTVVDCIQKINEALQMIESDETIPQDIRQKFQSLHKKEIFQVHQDNFLETVADGIDLAEKLTNPQTEADFDSLKKLADKIDACNCVCQNHPSACRESLSTILHNQFSRITGDFLNKAEEFIKSFNDDIDAALKENEALNGKKELSDEKCRELNSKFIEFTGKIRPFYDAMTGSGIDDKEPECLQKFKNDCRQTLAKFEALPKNVQENGWKYMEYRNLTSFPYLENRAAENARKKQIKA